MKDAERWEVRRRLDAMVEVLALAEGERFGIAYGSKFTPNEIAARLSDARTALPRLLDALERAERERDQARWDLEDQRERTRSAAGDAWDFGQMAMQMREALRGFVQLLDGQTEPLHPVSWLTTLEAGKRALDAPAAPPEKH